MDPVPLDLYPDYVNFVARPMSFADIDRMIKDYPSFAALAADVLLICDNCRAYNLPV
jgi:hypothetical protein